LERMRQQCAEERQRVVAAGGLHIIGTERHESRRIDNQLRGRAGRQGDPGSSRFFVSLEDDIMRRFGGDRIKGFMEWAGLEDDVPIEHSLVNRSLDSAQTKVEGYNFDIRKHLVDYDDVMNSQRDLVYRERRKILSGSDLRSNVLEFVHAELDAVLDRRLAGEFSDDWDLQGLINDLRGLLQLPPDVTVEQLEAFSREELVDLTHDFAERLYTAKEEGLGEDGMRFLERVVMLRTIGSLWVEHLTAMDDMRQGISLRAYGQSDPLVAYKREAHDMYDQFMQAIRRNVAATIYNVTLTPVAPVQQQEPPRETHTNRGEVIAEARARFPASEAARAAQPAGARPMRGPAPSVARPPAAPQKVGRNDPCWCGSGRKFKRCHGANA